MFSLSALPRSVSAALADAAHSKASVRCSTVVDLVRHAQGERADVKAGRCLLQLATEDSDGEVRAAALIGLADVGLREGLPHALRCAAHRGEDRSLGEVRSAFVALGELAERGEAPYEQFVSDWLGEPSQPPIRYQALVAAGQLFPLERLCTVVVSELSHEDPHFRDLACRLAEEHWLTRPEILVPDSLLAAVRGLLTDPNVRLRSLAAICLGSLGGEEARACLAASLNERDCFSEMADEQAAVVLCGELSVVEAVPGLQRRARRRVFGREGPFEFHATVALATMGQRRAIERIVRGLTARNRWTRTRAAAAAAAARVEQARPLLEAMQRSDRQVDQSTVAEALSALDRRKSSLVARSAQY